MVGSGLIRSPQINPELQKEKESEQVEYTIRWKFLLTHEAQFLIMEAYPSRQ